MTMTNTRLAARLVLAIGFMGLFAACGSTSPNTGSAPFLQDPASLPVSVGGAVPSAFTNAVPETPWWWKVQPVPPVQSSEPVTLAWSLSGDVLFDSGSATLSTSALSQLSGIMAEAKQHPGASIVVVGYTDNVPDLVFPGGNLGLSTARSSVVADLFTNAEIQGDHISHYGEGSADPVATNDNSEGQQKNRRVTILLTVP